MHQHYNIFKYICQYILFSSTKYEYISSGNIPKHALVLTSIPAGVVEAKLGQRERPEQGDTIFFLLFFQPKTVD